MALSCRRELKFDMHNLCSTIFVVAIHCDCPASVVRLSCNTHVAVGTKNVFSVKYPSDCLTIVARLSCGSVAPFLFESV